MRLIRQCGLSAELFLKKTKLRQVRFIRRAAYLPENTVYIRPCLETRAITLAHAGTRANYFACVIYRTRKIASNVFFLLLLF